MKERHAVLALLIAIGIVLLTPGVSAEPVAPVMPERVALENGLTLILAPIAGTDQVTVVSMYRAGFMDEPEGMTMVSALAGRMINSGATKSYKAGEAFELLSKNGVANGETMQSFTHCDYQVPSDELELALKIEGERLSGLKITQELVDSQLALCYDEVTGMEQVPMAGQYKPATAALGQAWRYRAKSVTVRSGLETVPLARIQDYHRSRFQPSGAAVVIAGDFDRAKALDLAKKHLGSITSQKTIPARQIKWESLPNRIEVQWDSETRALCIAFRPTGSVTDRYLLQTLGGLMMGALMADEQVRGSADWVICADPVQTLNSLPFYVYATAKQGVTMDALQGVVEAALKKALDDPSAKECVTQAIEIARCVGKTPVPAAEELLAAVQQMFPGSDPKDSIGMVMGQVALQFGFEELITGGKKDYLSIPDDTTPEAVLARLKAMLDPLKEFVTVLTPMQKSE